MRETRDAQSFQELQPGPDAVRKAARGPLANAGFTIIEILLVIALMGVIMLMALPNFNVVPGTEAAQKMGNLVGDISSAYDMAVLHKKYYRLAFEFKTGDYWLETTERERFYLGDTKLDRDPSPDEIKEENAEFEEKFERYVELAGKDVEDSENEKVIKATSPVLAARSKLKPVEWKTVEDAEWNRRSLGPSFVIRGAQMEHHTRLQTLEELGENGYAYLYFFPSGYVERAVIYIAPADLDDRAKLDEQTYTIVTEPYEGSASVSNGYKEVDLSKDAKER